MQWKWDVNTGALSEGAPFCMRAELSKTLEDAMMHDADICANFYRALALGINIGDA